MSGDFFNMAANILTTTDNMQNVAKTLEKLGSKNVYVGIPQKNSTRRGEKLNNAELGFLLEEGSPINNVPPRPFLKPSIEHNMPRLLKQQEKVFTSVLEENQGASLIELEKLGLLGQNFARGWFTNPANGWPPNTPGTIAKKKSARPNIDTSQVRNSITYVVSDD